MQSSVIRASLYAGRKPSGRLGLPLGDFVRFLQTLSPLTVDALFRERPGVGFSLDFCVGFRKGHSWAAALLQDALIRAEFELGFDFEAGVAETPLSIGPDVPAAELVSEDASLPSGKPVAAPLPIVGAAARLLGLGRDRETDVGYRLRLVRRSSDPGRARELVPALAELDLASGRGASLKNELRATLELVRGEGWLAREQIYVAREVPEERYLVEEVIRDELREGLGGLASDVADLRWAGSETDYDMASLSGFVGACRESSYLTRVFETIVPFEEDGRLQRIVSESGERKSAQVPNGDYAFISYAHGEAEYARAVLESLQDEGIRCWSDHQLQTGSVWDEELENRIRECGVLIACVSDSYQNSRVCKRELKFADLMGKPVLPVAAKSWTWGPGLQMMFQELQVTTAKSAQDLSAFAERARNVAPQIVGSAL